MIGTQVADGTFQIPTDYPDVIGAPLWIYAVRADAVALIDAGISTSIDAVAGGALREIGVELEAIKHVVLTHGHPDHQGGAAQLHAVAGAAISAPLDDAVWIEEPNRQWRELWDGYPGAVRMDGERDDTIRMCGSGVRIDHFLRDGDAIALGDRELSVIQTRGHTRGHITLLDGTTGCLFTGDMVQGRGLRSTSGRHSFSPMYQDVVDYRNGLRRLQSGSWDTMCGAHMPPLHRAAGLERIQESLDFVDEVDLLIRSAVLDRGAPVPTRRLAGLVGRLVGCQVPVSVQTVSVAVAHLHELARTEGFEEGWGRPGMWAAG